MCVFRFGGRVSVCVSVCVCVCRGEQGRGGMGDGGWGGTGYSHPHTRFRLHGTECWSSPISFRAGTRSDYSARLDNPTAAAATEQSPPQSLLVNLHNAYGIPV